MTLESPDTGDTLGITGIEISLGISVRSHDEAPGAPGPHRNSVAGDDGAWCDPTSLLRGGYLFRSEFWVDAGSGG